MVETTSKPTDISKIQDIMNAINTNNTSSENNVVMKVDYAAGSKLESNILALKGIAIQQAGYLKKIVEYQDIMLSTARSESVSSVATNNNTVPDETPKPKSDGVLASIASGAAGAVLGPLGPLLIDLVVGSFKFIFKGISSGVKLAFKGLSFLVGSVVSNLANVIKSVGGGLTNAVKSIASNLVKGAGNFISKGASIVRGGLTNLAAGAKTVTGNIVKGAGSLISKGANVVGNVVQGAGSAISKGANIVGGGLTNLAAGTKNLVGGAAKTVATEAVEAGGKAAATSAAKSIAAKAAAKTALKAVPGLGLFAAGGFAAERAYRGDYLGAGIEGLSGLASLLPFIGTAASIGLSGVNAARDINAAMAPTTVPKQPITPPQQAPIVIAPPGAPASSVVNSNNQQTTIINQTKDVSASLYTQMLGGNR